MKLPDGREAILLGGDGPGEWFVRDKDGHPDMDQPVDVYKEFNVKRPPDLELPQP